jgi:hypothetical protein
MKSAGNCDKVLDQRKGVAFVNKPNRAMKTARAARLRAASHHRLGRRHVETGIEAAHIRVHQAHLGDFVPRDRELVTGNRLRWTANTTASSSGTRSLYWRPHPAC